MWITSICKTDSILEKSLIFILEPSVQVQTCIEMFNKKKIMVKFLRITPSLFNGLKTIFMYLKLHHIRQTHLIIHILSIWDFYLLKLIPVSFWMQFFRITPSLCNGKDVWNKEKFMVKFLVISSCLFNGSPTILCIFSYTTLGKHIWSFMNGYQKVYSWKDNKHSSM